MWYKLLVQDLSKPTFVDSNNQPLSTVDVFLLSKVTLGQYNIELKHCPTSLVFPTSRLRCSGGWVNTFWKLSHAQVGGCSDRNWTIYSVHCLYYLESAPLSLKELPFLLVVCIESSIHELGIYNLSLVLMVHRPPLLVYPVIVYSRYEIPLLVLLFRWHSHQHVGTYRR